MDADKTSPTEQTILKARVFIAECSDVLDVIEEAKTNQSVSGSHELLTVESFHLPCVYTLIAFNKRQVLFKLSEIFDL